jgi:exopolysaccharide biosynthesis protein
MRDPQGITRGRGFLTAAATAVVVVVAMISVVSSTAAPLSAVAAASVAPAASGLTREKGLHIYAISGRQYGVFTAIHVLTFSGSEYKVKIVLAHRALDRGEQTPSSMCQTTADCVAAVNGDFFDMTHSGAPDPGDEVGGIIQNCVLLHTPETAHQQVNLDGQSVSEGLNWSDTVDANGFNVPITAINQELPMSYIRVHLPLTGTLLFTPPYALRTPSATGRVTYEFIQVDGSASPTRINTTAQLELVAKTARAVKVRAGYVDISAPSGSTLTSLRVGETVTMTTTSTAGCDNIGGHPILINQGVVARIVPADTYMLKPYARTAIGWTALGGTVIMTVDGKDGVSGATAYQLVSLLQSLNVVTALDLDGGNSTTLYAKGRILNRPSHGTERPVSTGLVVVRNSKRRP